ncbi:GIY-YIG nuclease family protein [Bradyrhizobium elkanii]|uniref:GIY-YIG nuclease family protein n=1 Tax=Bradyrhizobium elkanii TaxID=29448 RepID=UPI0035171EE7
MRLPGDVPEDGHFVYVIQEDGATLACKVGVSADPRERLIQLQCATWRRLVLAAAFLAADSNEARYLERAVHQAFAGLHLTGEWFSVTAERAVSEIRSCAEAGGVIIKAARLIERSTCNGAHPALIGRKE